MEGGEGMEEGLMAVKSHIQHIAEVVLRVSNSLLI